MRPPDKRHWRDFERIIAAIEYATSHGAAVTWNENIAGRQFDVAIRFKNGPHDYLTLIECKDHKAAVPVGEVDAFATKARDANASKAVLVSRAGFQSGCREVAKRHGIELLRLHERFNEPPGAENVPLETTIGAYHFVIYFPDERAPLPIPETNNRLDYLLLNGVIRQNGISETLKQLLDRIVPRLPEPKEFEEPEERTLPLSGATLEIKSFLPRTEVRALALTIIKQRKKFIVTGGMDHHLTMKMNTAFELVDCLRDDIAVTAVAALDLPIGFGTVFRPGIFYTNMLEQNYYCEGVTDGTVTLVVVECYSNGVLCRARVKAKAAEVAKYYVQLTDPVEIVRLQALYREYMERPLSPLGAARPTI